MFTEISPNEIILNPVTAFGREWMLLAAGNENRGCNAMTIAWGQFGALWELKSHTNRLPAATCYVRPSRYTKTFMDTEPYFTLSSFSQKYRKALGYMGSYSGRDGDKIHAAGLTAVYDYGTVFFDEAETVYICRKLYHAPLVPEGFVDRELIPFNYPEEDFHEMYVGEIVKVLRKEQAI